MYKTKPICRRGPDGTGPAGRGAWGKCAKRTQFGRSGGAPEGEMCKTKPISEEVSSAKCQVLSETCKTNPISEGVPSVKFGAGGSGGEFPAPSHIPHYSNIPLFHHSSPMPIVQNEPNFRERTGRGRVPVVQTKPIRRRPAISRGRLCETKPIAGRAGWDEAAGARDGGQMCKTNPIRRHPIIPLFQYSIIPIFESCKTSPIWPRRAKDAKRTQSPSLRPVRAGCNPPPDAGCAPPSSFS
jgi:hypothetical protein